MGTADGCVRRCAWLQGAVLALLLTAGGYSWPLWLQSGDYPRIPLFVIVRGWPETVCWLFLGSLLLGMTGAIGGALRAGWTGREISVGSRVSWCLVIAGLLGMILWNQHCLQVWVWQGLWLGVGFALLPTTHCLAWARWLTLSIYVYSAISKLDYAFLDTYGQTLLQGLWQALPFWPEHLEVPRDWKFRLAWLFPLGELAIAGLLVLPVTRQVGWWLSLAMHVCLILTLGPAGLNHHPPVLIWNFYFLLQNTLLFTRGAYLTASSVPDLTHITPTPADNSAGAPGSGSEAIRPSTQRRTWLVRGLLGFMLLFPATEWIGICDVWPGWGLYAARGARVRLHLPRDPVPPLPAEWRPFLQPAPLGGAWRHFDTHRWSFAALGLPSYPQDRFQLGVARAVLDHLPADSEFLIIHHSPANRFTGNRQTTQLESLEELERFAQRYWLNARPVPLKQ